MQSISHPGVPKCDADGCFSFTSSGSSELRCLVLEKIAGQNLEQWLQKHGPISQALALKWMRQLVEILEQVHQKGFLHQDVKPSNIIRRPDDHLMLIDFEEGIVSAGYTPREQVNEDKAVPQSDFFALGRTFTHLLTGRHPVDLPKDSETRRLIWRSEAPQVSEPLANLIDQLMDSSVDKRPQTAQQILQRLSQITEQPLLHRIERLETQTDSINQHLEKIPAQIAEISRIISERIEEIDCQLECAEQTSSQHIRGINSKVSRLHQWGALFGLLLSLLVGVLLWLSIQQEPSPVVLTTPSQCLPNMKNDVNSLAFSLPKGKYLATTSLDTTARVWEMSNRSVKPSSLTMGF